MKSAKPPQIRLKPGSRRARALAGHPWVFANEIDSIPDAEWNGKALPLVDSKDRPLGNGILNTASQIIWRKFDSASDWNADFIRKSLEKAYRNREESEEFQRIVWSEADCLPGVIIDQYQDVFVVQLVTLGADTQAGVIEEWITEQFQPRDILFRNDTPSRQLEGLPLNVRTASGKPLDPFWVEIYGIRYWLDLAGSQKTGFYLDQRQEAFKVATFAEDWRVLDGCCNQGAFALNAARAGAREVIGIDVSGPAIARAQRNARENQLDIHFLEANLFDWFTENRSEKFDLVILDPPSFARNRKAVAQALKGYGELHLRALKSLTPGGILATYCCSHHVTRQEFLDSIAKAARHAGRHLQLLYEASQPIDHPVVFHFPESAYLKGAICRVLD